MKVTHYHLDGPIKGLCKQHAIWARESGANGHFPLVFFQRPKWITDDAAWAQIVRSVQLKLPRGFEVK